MRSDNPDWTISAWSDFAWEPSAHQPNGEGDLELFDDGFIAVGGECYCGSRHHNCVPWDVVWWLLALNAYGMCEGLRAMCKAADA